jgi:hypothetical protein
MNNCPTHIAFADETHYNTGRYRGLALVSLPFVNVAAANRDLSGILLESNVKELKWKELTSAKVRFAAVKQLKWLIGKVRSQQLRVDVLIWDIEDQRHRIRHRDDLANMQRMYYQLFKNVLSERWPDESTWWLFPDEHTAMKWDELSGFLEKKSARISIKHDLFTQARFYLDLKNRFHIEKMEPRQSHLEPLIQLADLLAGLGVYSRTAYDKYTHWCSQNSPQLSLFRSNHDAIVRLTSSDRERCQVLHAFNAACKDNSLGVSLRSNCGLRTHNPRQPINFWWYMPQHDEDRAPVKGLEI